MSALEPATTDGAGCLRTLAIFALVASPVYLLMRVVARAARQLYGFEPVPDEPPLLICPACHNTILERGTARESGWNHCPYCGAELPADSSEASTATDAVGSDGADRQRGDHGGDDGGDGVGNGGGPANAL